MTDVTAAGAGELAAAVTSGSLSAEEVVTDALTRLEASTELRAVITICGERALARACSGVSGRLAGVPLLVKDLIDTAGVRTTYASRIYRDHVPERSASAVVALEAEGAIVVAKANADEFAWGVTGQNPHYGDIVNPLAPGRISGGSSGGNAAALAAGAVPLALGTASAARCASRPRPARSSASSRRSGEFPSTGCIRSRPALTPSDRWRAAWPTAP